MKDPPTGAEASPTSSFVSVVTCKAHQQAIIPRQGRPAGTEAILTSNFVSVRSYMYNVVDIFFPIFVFAGFFFRTCRWAEGWGWGYRGRVKVGFHGVVGVSSKGP